MAPTGYASRCRWSGGLPWASLPCSSPLHPWRVAGRRATVAEDGDNLQVWRLADGQMVASFFQRSQANWAPQWTDDEARMARQAPNEIHVYDGHDPAKGIVQRVRLEGVTMLWTAPGPAPHKFAAFTPEKKARSVTRSAGAPCGRPLTGRRWSLGRRGTRLATDAQAAPANVRIYAYDAPQAPLSQKTFFKAEKVSLYWNRPGACLAPRRGRAGQAKRCVLSTDAAAAPASPRPHRMVGGEARGGQGRVRWC